MSVPTTNRNYPFPDEWMNPYYDDFWDMFEAIDQDVQDAWDSIAGNATMDAAYDNFGALPALVEIDGAEGQGDLVFEVADTASFVVDLENVLGADVDGFFIENNTDYFRFYQGGTDFLNISAMIHDYDLQGSGSWGVDVAGDVSVSAATAIEMGCDDYMELYSEQDVTIEWGDASTWTGLDASLIIQTDTSGNIELVAAQELNFTWDADSVWSGNGASLEIETDISGDIEIGSAETLSLDWSATSIWTGNDAGLTIQTLTGGDIDVLSIWDLTLQATEDLSLASVNSSTIIESGDYMELLADDYITIDSNAGDIGLGTNSGDITFEASGGGIGFAWDGWNDVIFDLVNCDDPEGEGPGLATWRVQNGADYLELSRQNTDLLNLDAEFYGIDIDASSSFYLDAPGIYLDGSNAIHLDAWGTSDSWFRVRDADLEIRVVTGGDLWVSADAGDVTMLGQEVYFYDQWLTVSNKITLSESGETALDTTSQSIVGSTNELVATIGALTFDDMYNNDSGERIVIVDDGDMIFRIADTEIFSLQPSLGSDDDNISITGVSTTGLSVRMEIADLDIDMSSTLELDSVGNSYLAVDSGDLDFSTTTSGDMNLASVGDVTFVDQWLVGVGAISLSESGGTKLDTTSQSIVGAINEIFGLLP